MNELLALNKPCLILRVKSGEVAKLIVRVLKGYFLYFLLNRLSDVFVESPRPYVASSDIEPER